MANISKIKLSGVTYNIVDESAIHSLEGYATTGDVQSVVTAATAIIQDEIDGVKANVSTVSGKVDTNTADIATISGNVATVSGDVETLKTQVADKTELEKKFGYVTYDKQAQKIYFKASETGATLGEVGVEDFVKDAMVESVEIEDGNLVITWNEDADLEPTKIPLTDIFNPSNYMTKAETEVALEKKVDESAFTESIEELEETIATKADKSDTYTKKEVDDKITESGHFDESQYYKKTDVDGLLEAKQDKLVSGTNIKTVGGASVLGSGNIQLMTAKVEGDTLEFEFA